MNLLFALRIWFVAVSSNTFVVFDFVDLIHDVTVRLLTSNINHAKNCVSHLIKIRKQIHT